MASLTEWTCEFERTPGDSEEDEVQKPAMSLMVTKEQNDNLATTTATYHLISRSQTLCTI